MHVDNCCSYGLSISFSSSFLNPQNPGDGLVLQLRLEVLDLKTQITNFDIQELQWSESKGSAADDGFTTELVAVKGKAIVSGKTEKFSFMVKQTPEIAGRRLDMCMEVKHEH